MIDDMSKSKNSASVADLCSHYKSRQTALTQIAKKLQTSLNQHASCQECLATSTLWICVDCEKYVCSNECYPISHLLLHSCSFDHPMAIYLGILDQVFCVNCGTCQPIIRDEGEYMEASNDIIRDAGTKRFEQAAMLEAGDAISTVAAKIIVEEPPENAIVRKATERFELIRESRLERAYTVKGMPNQENTCFFNSVLQNLLAMDQLKDLVCSLTPVGNITENLQNLYISQHSDYLTLDPTALLDSIRAETKQFEVDTQQDSHELLQLLIIALEREDKSVVDQTFKGKLLSTVSCAQCEKQSGRCEAFHDLSLQVPSKMSSTKTNDGRVYVRLLEGGDIIEDGVVDRIKELKLKGISEDMKLNSSDMSSYFSDKAEADEEDPSLSEMFWDLNIPIGEDVMVDQGAGLSSTNESSADMGVENDEVVDVTYTCDDSWLNACKRLLGGVDSNEDTLVARVELKLKGISPGAPAADSSVIAENMKLNSSDFSENPLLLNGNAEAEEENPSEFYHISDLKELICEEVVGLSSANEFRAVKDVTYADCWRRVHEHLKEAGVRGKDLKLEGISENSKQNSSDNSSDFSDKAVVDEEDLSVSDRISDLDIGDAANECVTCLVDDTNGPLSVEGCLKLFTGEESLPGMRCEDCAHSEQRKRLLIASAPSILAIHLKRFCQTASRQMKIKGHIEFQEILDLTPYMDPRCLELEDEVFMYRLTGVVEHIGSTPTAGHYVAFVQRNQSYWDEQDENPTWFKASDSDVRKVTLDEVLRSEAYLLFFERVST